MQKIILHIDFDSFFASCEQQFNPTFRNKPLGVTATNGRTCIIASSSQAKRLGIKTGTRSWEAKKICPEIIFTPAHFEKYLEISKKFLNICKDYSPFVEVFSIDEVFMDVTLTVHLFGGPYGIVQTIKERIKKDIGEFITVSVGISYNKHLAKMASSLKKPNGIFKIEQDDVQNLYKQAKLTDVCGIGERIKIRLNKIGIYNLLEIRDFPFYKLVKEFGKVEANFLKNIGQGVDNSSLNLYTSPTEVKSVGRNYCLPRNEYDLRIVMQNVYELCEEIGIKLRRLNKKARTVGFSLRGSLNICGRKTFGTYFDSGSEIFNLCVFLMNQDISLDTYSSREPRLNRGESRSVSSRPALQQSRTIKFPLPENYIRQISIWASNLEDSKNLTLSLFESAKKSNSLTKTIDSINERFGDHTIRNGFLLYADKLTTVPNGYFADRYEREKLSKLFVE